MQNKYQIGFQNDKENARFSGRLKCNKYGDMDKRKVIQILNQGKGRSKITNFKNDKS